MFKGSRLTTTSALRSSPKQPSFSPALDLALGLGLDVLTLTQTGEFFSQEDPWLLYANRLLARPHSLTPCPPQVPASWSEYRFKINPFLFESFGFPGLGSHMLRVQVLLPQ